MVRMMRKCGNDSNAWMKLDKTDEPAVADSQLRGDRLLSLGQRVDERGILAAILLHLHHCDLL